MKKIAIVYGSTTNNTKSVAEMIAEKLARNEVKLMDVANLKTGDLDAYPNLILGTSTWGLGDLQDDWEDYLSALKSLDLTGKVVALFGLGDGCSYPDTFVDGMGALYDVVKGRAEIIGRVSTKGYVYDGSGAIEADEFVGLVLDEDNESNLTDGRVNAWLTAIEPSLK